MLSIFQNVACHSKPFLSAWFQIKHHVGIQRWYYIFVSPRKELHFVWMYLSCDSNKLWIVSGVLENHHVIGIQTKTMLIFIEQILHEIDHRKFVMMITCQQSSNCKALWSVTSIRSFHIFHIHFHKLLKQILLMLCIIPNNAIGWGNYDFTF